MEIKKSFLVNNGGILPIILVTALFFFWGLPTSLNDILIKQFMKSFELNRFKAGLIQSAFYLGYFLFAIPAATIMKKFGYKTGLVLGLVFFGIGCFLFHPAAKAGTYGFFLFALFIIASGLAFLETGANPFITEFGDPSSSERRLNLAQAFNPFGVITGVTIGTLFIFSGIEPKPHEINIMKEAGVYKIFLRQETFRVVAPYTVIGIIVIFWALLLIFMKFPKLESERNQSSNKGKLRDLLKYPHFVKSVIAQFFYVGAQAGTWSFFIQYIQDYTGKPEKIAGTFLIGSLVAFTIGRFSSTWLMKYIRPNRLMGIYSFINVFLVATGIIFTGYIGIVAILLSSFFMSLMFPTIFALGLKGLGENTKLGGSLIVMAILGGAILPPLMGLIVLYTNSMAIALIIPLLCYVYITWYSFKGAIQNS